MVDPVTIWFEIEQYEDKREKLIANLVETTWMYRYPIPIEIMYDQGKEFIGHEFRKSQIETEYGISSKPTTLVNTMSNAVLERIHQVLINLVRNSNISIQTYVNEDDLWMVILAVLAFEIISKTNRPKFYSPG